MAKVLSSTIMPTKVPDNDRECINENSYPKLKASDFRKNFRIDETVNDNALCNFLTNSAFAINKDLANIKLDFDNEKNKILYLQAVGARAKSMILETYTDIDTKKNADGEAVELPADDWKQQSREALRLLLQKPRATIALI